MLIIVLAPGLANNNKHPRTNMIIIINMLMPVTKTNSFTHLSVLIDGTHCMVGICIGIG